MARILYPSAEAVISTGPKRVLLHVITFFSITLDRTVRTAFILLSAIGRQMYVEIFCRGIVLRTHTSCVGVSKVGPMTGCPK